MGFLYVLDVNTVQENWGKLREAYNAAMRRRRTKSGAGSNNQPAWRLEHQMKWLDDYSHIRK